MAEEADIHIDTDIIGQWAPAGEGGGHRLCRQATRVLMEAYRLSRGGFCDQRVSGRQKVCDPRTQISLPEPAMDQGSSGTLVLISTQLFINAIIRDCAQGGEMVQLMFGISLYPHFFLSFPGRFCSLTQITNAAPNQPQTPNQNHRKKNPAHSSTFAARATRLKQIQTCNHLEAPNTHKRCENNGLEGKFSP